MSFSRSSLLGLALRYGLAVASVALLVVLKARLIPHLGPEAPFLMGVVPALIITWYCGPGPGALAAALSTAAILAIFVSPEEQEGGHGAVTVALKTILFAGENGIVVALMATFQSSRTSTEQALARIQSSYELSAACGRAQDAHEAAEAVLRPLLATLGASGASVFLAAPEERKLRLFAYRVPPWQAKLIPLYAETLLESPTAIAHVARTRKAVFVENEAQWRALLPEAFGELRKHVVLRAGLCVPMIVRDTLRGVLVAGFSDERRFSAEDRAWTQALADDFGRALDRVRLLETEQRAVNDAAQASRAKDDFLGLLTEELRAQPLSIGAWMRSVRKHPDDRSLATRAGQAIDRCVHLQGRLIEGLLDQSRTVARELQIEAKRVNVTPLLRSGVERLRIDATAMGVDLELVARVQAEVTGDARRLERAMQDFVSATLASTPRGGVVRAEIGVQEGRVRVRIASDPRGGENAAASPNRAGTAGARSPEGPPDAGTGLLIARDLLKCHGGDVHVDLAHGRPRTVTIDLPLRDPMAGVIAMISPTRPVDGGAPSPLRGLRVFLVSDDAVERESIADIATNQGAEVRSAISTSDAIDQLRVFSPDIVVTDIVASERLVLGFIRQLRALPTPAAAAPALAYTAASASDQVRAIVDAGYQRRLPRPPEAHALTQAMVELRAPNSRGQSPQS
jgi:K+-sensing histidine kinase KdpD/CheY-like chemotaxis protein